MSNKETTDDRTSLEKLDTGLLTQHFHQQIKAPSSATLKISAHTYSTEVRRVLDELHLTLALIKQINFEDKLKVNGKVIRGENLVNYYAGTFFGLTHQAQDKLLRLIDMLATTGSTKKPYPLSSVVSVTGVLRKHTKALADIKDFLTDLEAHTQGEHVVSHLRPAAHPRATTEYITKRSIETFKYHKREIIDKQATTINAIDTTIQQIADKLIDRYKVPASYDAQAKLSKEWLDYLSEQSIKNEVLNII